MDVFDEFEFKPLTDGLGFHKKPVNLKQAVENADVAGEAMRRPPPAAAATAPASASDKHRAVFDQVLTTLEKTPLARHAFQDPAAPSDYRDPLPRETVKSVTSGVLETPVAERPFSSPFPKRELFKVDTGVRRGAADSPTRPVLVASPLSVSAAILDFLVVVGMTMIFMVSLLSITKIDLMRVVTQAQADFMTQVSLGLLFVSVLQMYVILSRSFYGRTLGEWTFDYQLGRDEDHELVTYPLLVAWRSLLMTATGLILLPFLSLIFGQDLAAKLTGLQLYREKI